jgi:ATP-binding cassette subfamily B multidrug efflux pump
MSTVAKLNITIFKRLVHYTKPYRRIFIIAFICTVLLAFLGPLRPKLIGEMVSRYIVESANANELLLWTLLILGLLLIEACLQFAGTFMSNLLAQSIIRDMRKKLFAHITTFRMRYFDRTPNGSIVTRVVSDLEAVSEVFSSGLIDVLGDLISLIAVVSMMFMMNWQLTFLTLIPIPLLIIATRIFARAMRKSFQQERLQVTRLNTFVQERISGMSIVQLFNREKQYQRCLGFLHIFPNC